MIKRTSYTNDILTNYSNEEIIDIIGEPCNNNLDLGYRFELLLCFIQKSMVDTMTYDLPKNIIELETNTYDAITSFIDVYCRFNNLEDMEYESLIQIPEVPIQHTLALLVAKYDSFRFIEEDFTNIINKIVEMLDSSNGNHLIYTEIEPSVQYDKLPPLYMDNLDLTVRAEVFLSFFYNPVKFVNLLVTLIQLTFYDYYGVMSEHIKHISVLKDMKDKL